MNDPTQYWLSVFRFTNLQKGRIRRRLNAVSLGINQKHLGLLTGNLARKNKGRLGAEARTI